MFAVGGWDGQGREGKGESWLSVSFPLGNEKLRTKPSRSRNNKRDQKKTVDWCLCVQNNFLY